MKRLVLMGLLSGCGSSLYDFQQQVEAARGCDHNVDRCVLAGASKCLCATAVNLKHQTEVNDAAKGVACSGAPKCAAMLNPRCSQNDVCISDQQ